MACFILLKGIAHFRKSINPQYQINCEPNSSAGPLNVIWAHTQSIQNSGSYPHPKKKKMIKEEEEEAFERKQGLKKIKKLSNSVNSFLCLISKLNTFKKF